MLDCITGAELQRFHQGSVFFQANKDAGKPLPVRTSHPTALVSLHFHDQKHGFLLAISTSKGHSNSAACRFQRITEKRPFNFRRLGKLHRRWVQLNAVLTPKSQGKCKITLSLLIISLIKRKLVNFKLLRCHNSPGFLSTVESIY